MTKIYFTSKLHIGKYPNILNQPYFFVFNDQLSVNTYEAIEKPKLAVTTLQAIQLIQLIEILNAQSKKTPIIVIPQKKSFKYSEQENKLLFLLKSKRIKYVSLELLQSDNSFDTIIKSEQNKFMSYICKVENCVPVLSKLTKSWTITN